MTSKLLSIAGLSNQDHSKSKTNESSSENESRHLLLSPTKDSQEKHGAKVNELNGSPIKIQVVRPKAH